MDGNVWSFTYDELDVLRAMQRGDITQEEAERALEEMDEQ